MAFYDASAAASGSGSGSAAGPTTYTPQHTTSLPHLAPQGNSGPSNDTQSQAQAQVSLDFTDAQVEEFREQDRFLPVSHCHSRASATAGRVAASRPRSLSISRPTYFAASLRSALTEKQIANVARIMKNALPGSAKVSKEAKECVQECVSEFISFIVSPPFCLLHPCPYSDF